VRARTELCTTPERGSAVEVRRGDDGDLVRLSPELGAFSDIEPGGEPVDEADEVVEEVGSVDAVPAADSAEESDVVDDDEPRDGLEELASVGSANAIPGVVATAPPTPSANARTPARTMCCTSIGTALRGWAPAQRSPRRASSASRNPAPLRAVLAMSLADAAGWRCLADVVGLCGLLMTRRCPLWRAHEVCRRARAGEATRPALSRGTSSASPQRRCNQLQSGCRADPPLHPRRGVPA